MLIEKDQIIIETKDENILWKELLSKSITEVDELNAICRCDIEMEELKSVIKKYPMMVNPYYPLHPAKVNYSGIVYTGNRIPPEMRRA